MKIKLQEANNNSNGRYSLVVEGVVINVLNTDTDEVLATYEDGSDFDTLTHFDDLSEMDTQLGRTPLSIQIPNSVKDLMSDLRYETSKYEDEIDLEYSFKPSEGFDLNNDGEEVSRAFEDEFKRKQMISYFDCDWSSDELNDATDLQGQVYADNADVHVSDEEELDGQGFDESLNEGANTKQLSIEGLTFKIKDEDGIDGYSNWEASNSGAAKMHLDDFNGQPSNQTNAVKSLSKVKLPLNDKLKNIITNVKFAGFDIAPKSAGKILCPTVYYDVEVSSDSDVSDQDLANMFDDDVLDAMDGNPITTIDLTWETGTGDKNKVSHFTADVYTNNADAYIN